jgi:hypothetical protein
MGNCNTTVKKLFKNSKNNFRISSIGDTMENHKIVRSLKSSLSQEELNNIKLQNPEFLNGAEIKETTIYSISKDKISEEEYKKVKTVSPWLIEKKETVVKARYVIEIELEEDRLSDMVLGAKKIQSAYNSINLLRTNYQITEAEIEALTLPGKVAEQFM